MRGFCPIVLACILLWSCGKNEEEEKEKQFLPAHNKAIHAASDTVIFNPAQFDGMLLFMKFCNKCHPGGEEGIGPALNDKKLPNFLIHWQVRLGGGKMPDFKKEEISQDELDKIVAFLRLMREKAAS